MELLVLRQSELKRADTLISCEISYEIEISRASGYMDMYPLGSLMLKIPGFRDSLTKSHLMQ